MSESPSVMIAAFVLCALTLILHPWIHRWSQNFVADVTVLWRAGKLL